MGAITDGLLTALTKITGPRAYVDVSSVPEHQWDMDRRLKNWAAACRGGDKRTGAAAPMFMFYRSSEAKREYGAETSVPVDRSDAIAVGKGISFLPEKHRKAIDWFYLHPRNPSGKARELGLTLQGLSEHVVEGRQILINRGV
jgi:hypothetical protein